MFTVHSTVYSEHCKLDSEQCTVYSRGHCVQLTAEVTVYSVQQRSLCTSEQAALPLSLPDRLGPQHRPHRLVKHLQNWKLILCFSVAFLQVSGVSLNLMLVFPCTSLHLSRNRLSTGIYSTVLNLAVQYSTVKCITVQLTTVQCSTVKFTTVYCSTLQLSSEYSKEYSTVPV